MLEKKILKEVDDLLRIAEELAAYGKVNGGDTDPDKITDYHFWLTRFSSLVDKIYPKGGSSTLKEVDKFKSTFRIEFLHSGGYTKFIPAIGILRSIKHEIETGLFDNLKQLIRAELFSSFLEMGEHLLNEGYKDAAAVIVGGVLEDMVKNLAIKNGIPIVNEKGKRLTIEPLNIDLCKAGVYDMQWQKEVTSWAELRNNAAHGDYSSYDDNKVHCMIAFVKSLSMTFLR